jgi:Flp pilus assembly protein CpaB
MSRRRALLTIVGSSVSALLVYAALHGRWFRQAIPASQGVNVVAAVRDLQIGVILAPEDVTLRKLPAASQARWPFRDKSQVVGKPTILPMAKGDVLIPADLGGECNPVPRRPSMRAVSIQIRKGTDSPDLRGGAQVDVLLARASPSRSRHRIIVLNRVTVLAVTRNLGGQEPTSVALLVTPEGALSIAAAKAKGQLEIAISGAKHS